MLGIGSFGVIREAVYIPAAEAVLAKHQRARECTLHQGDGRRQGGSISDDATVSIFDHPLIDAFAVKTIPKTQKNINDEILSWVAIQQEICQDKEDSQATTNCRSQIQHCVKLFDVYEDADSVHLVMEYCEGDTLDTLFNFGAQQIYEH